MKAASAKATRHRASNARWRCWSRVWAGTSQMSMSDAAGDASDVGAQLRNVGLAAAQPDQRVVEVRVVLVGEIAEGVVGVLRDEPG